MKEQSYTVLIVRMTTDERIKPVHISLFTALFISWQANGFQNPFSVSRARLMRFSKIASIATYHKCLRQLNEYGYIHYVPSYHPTIGSMVHWPGKEE
jgi:hypothetical protein